MDPQCTTCGLPSAHACPSCASYPSASDLTQPRTVGYCAPACQTSHIPLHADECAAARLRRLVVQLAEPLEEALLGYAAVTNELPVGKVRRRGKGVVELRLDWGEAKVPKMFEPSGTYYTFPVKDMQKLDKRTRQGVLMVNRCADVSCLVMPVLRKVLGPVLKPDTKIVLIITTIPARAIDVDILHVGPGSKPRARVDVRHFAVKFTLRSGEEFVADFSAPQFGWRTLVYPMARYWNEKCRRAPMKERSRQELLEAWEETYDEAADVIRAVDGRMDAWLAEREVQLDAFLEGGDEDGIVVFLGSFVRKFKKVVNAVVREREMGREDGGDGEEQNKHKGDE